MGVWAEPPAGSRGRAPSQVVTGRWRWKAFSLWTCNGSGTALISCLWSF